LRAIWCVTIANAYAYSQPISHSNGNGYFNANSNSYSNSNTNANSMHGEMYADAAAASYSRTAPLSHRLRPPTYKRTSTSSSMRRRYISDSGFLTRSAFSALVICAMTCFAVTRTLPGFFQGQTPANVSQRTLTFAERVTYQRAIEDVY